MFTPKEPRNNNLVKFLVVVELWYSCSLLPQPPRLGDRSIAPTGDYVMKCFVGLLIFLAALSAAPREVLGQQPDRAALLAFAQESLRFDSFCFSGDHFPICQFEHRERVEKLIGPYKLKVTFYDASGQVVTAPKKEAGRYGAVVEIDRPGRVSKRFFTLYNFAGNTKLGLRAAGAV